jgi:triacylglycerol esterase/lipase EstA (alpha/beta hydrolase family)
MRTPTRIESPRDDTEIVVNGRVMNVDSEMNTRIRADSGDEISPEAPPKYNRESNYKTTESNLTPNRYIPNEIKIIESPNNSRYDIKPLPMKEILPAPRARKETPPEVETVYSDNDSPKSAFTSFTTKTMKTTKTATTNRSSKSLFNMLPKFNKTAAPALPTIKSNTPDTLPRVKSPANPYQFIQDIKNPQEPE